MSPLTHALLATTLAAAAPRAFLDQAVLRRPTMWERFVHAR